MDDFLDPRTQALLAFGSNLLANGGPSLTPVPFGAAAGKATMAGLNQHQSARQAQMADQLRRAQLAEIQRKAKEAEFNQRIRGALFPELAGALTQNTTGVPQGALSGQPVGALYGDPDRLEKMGAYLALSGDPGAATLISTAERMRARNEERAAAESFKSRPRVLGAGVTTNSPQGRAMLSNLTGDQEFDSAVLQAQNDALNSNVRLRHQPVQAPKPGLFSSLTASPYVGRYAEELQGQIDSASGLKPQQLLQQHNNLLQMHQISANQAAARQENAAVRREIADMHDGTRRMIAGMNFEGRRDRHADIEAQRGFTREQSLAREYNDLTKDYRQVRPAFESAAQYLAGQKYDSSGDRALVFQYARTLDPKDRVGVNDIRDISKLGNVPERIKQAVVALSHGKELPDRVRLEMFQVMRNRFQNLNAQQAQIEEEYEERARRYMLRPDNVVIRYADRPKGKGGKPKEDRTRIRVDANGNEIP